VSFCTILSALCGGRWFWEGLQNIWSNSTFYNQYLGEVCSSGHGGKGNARTAWSFSNISVLQSVLLCYTRHQLGESGSQHLCILSKMAEKCKIVLTVKQKFEVIEKTENRELSTTLAKGCGIVIQIVT
jgi:hypothetical protein